MDLKKLADPFPVDEIHFRVGSTTGDKSKGMALAYLDARNVQDRLDSICGPENWQCRYPWSDGKKVVCEIGLNIGGNWVWKSNGAGDTDYEGEKGSLSDAFKRAAVLWGIGRYLYASPNMWQPIEKRGSSFAFTAAGMTNLKNEFTKWQTAQFGVVRNEYAKPFFQAMQSNDSTGIFELWEEMTEDQKGAIWRELNSHQKKTVKDLLQAARAA